jgi:hypothetical protein
MEFLFGIVVMLGICSVIGTLIKYVAKLVVWFVGFILLIAALQFIYVQCHGGENYNPAAYTGR